MKRILLTILVVLSVAAPCLSASAQPGNVKNASTQDLLIKSEVETAISMEGQK